MNDSQLPHLSPQVVLKFSAKLPAILGGSGPVFVAMKVFPEIQNEPIGRRRWWDARSRDPVLRDLKTELIVDA